LAKKAAIKRISDWMNCNREMHVYVGIPTDPLPIWMKEKCFSQRVPAILLFFSGSTA